MNPTRLAILKVLLQSGSADNGIAFLRVSIGVLAFRHGYDKLVNYSERAPDFLDPFGVGSETSLMLAIFAEVLCSLLLCIGLMTRLALVPLLVTMLVALFVAHANDPFAVKEMALVYLLIFVSLMVTGPGWISLDFLLTSRALND